MQDREQAWSLLCEYTESDSLRKHMLAVEAAMRAYAARYDADQAKWGIVGLKSKSVRKKMKQRSFAAAVHREDIVSGAEDLGVELNEHIQFVIDAMASEAQTLGLLGTPG